MNVGFVSLGCSKNLIDTEITIGLFKKNDYKIVSDPKEADIIVVNTCGFIDSAKEEAINTILEMAEYKEKRCKFLIVMGCLVQRYYEELKKALPEVDLFLRLDEYDNIWNRISEKIKEKDVKMDKINNEKARHDKRQIQNPYNMKPFPLPKENEFLNRVVTTGKNYAYLKIGEGCSNRCTYCAIPYIRGPFVSRKMEDILEEARILAKEGIRELIVIAQDTTKYGVDLYGEPKLAELLEELSRIVGIKWIRFLYSYPEGITDKLIEVVKNNNKICKYFDIPIQHISNSVLKRMNRHTSKENIETLLLKLRTEIPNVVLRTTLIVGFPGETKEDFDELYKFVMKTKFDKLGAFMYSKEDGTPAARIKEQVHHNTKKSRYNKIMSLQNKISKDSLKSKIGQKCEVLIETKTFDGKYYVGRTSQDVPDIDGLLFINANDVIEDLMNKFVICKIVDVKDYDFVGEVVENEC